MSIRERLSVVETKIKGMNKLLWILLVATFGIETVKFI